MAVQNLQFLLKLENKRRQVSELKSKVKVLEEQVNVLKKDLADSTKKSAELKLEKGNLETKKQSESSSNN
jgi:regulator of replication initiation timing